MKNPESLVTKSEAIAILSVTYTDDKEEAKLRRIEKILNQIKFNIRKELLTVKSNEVKGV